MFAGVVDEDIQPFVFGDSVRNGLLPCGGLSDIQFEALATAGKCLRQSVCTRAVLSNAQPDKILRRFGEERAGNGLAETAVGAGDEDDTGTHAGRFEICNLQFGITKSENARQ